MIWPPGLLTAMRVFLLVLAIVFLLSGTAMLVLTLPLRFPWTVHADLAARYAVVFLGIAVVCAWGIRSIDKNRR
jgi:hypothetical protein